MTDLNGSQSNFLFFKERFIELSESFTREDKELEYKNLILAPRKVLLVGAGALGSSIAYHLSGSNISSLIAYDDDIVEPRNIGSQMFPSSFIGMPKVGALEELYDNYKSTISNFIAVNEKFKTNFCRIKELELSCNEIYSKVLRKSREEFLLLKEKLYHLGNPDTSLEKRKKYILSNWYLETVLLLKDMTDYISKKHNKYQKTNDIDFVKEYEDFTFRTLRVISHLANNIATSPVYKDRVLSSNIFIGSVDSMSSRRDLFISYIYKELLDVCYHSIFNIVNSNKDKVLFFEREFGGEKRVEIENFLSMKYDRKISFSKKTKLKIDVINDNIYLDGRTGKGTFSVSYCLNFLTNRDQLLEYLEDLLFDLRGVPIEPGICAASSNKCIATLSVGFSMSQLNTALHNLNCENNFTKNNFMMFFDQKTSTFNCK